MDIRERVQRRIDEIGKSAITLAREAGLERGFINDILIGRKASIRHDKIEAVALALQCDPRYLLGEIDDPGSPPEEGMKYAKALPATIGVPILGVCETGVWRRPLATKHIETLKIAPDGCFPGAPQVCFEARGAGIAQEDGDQRVFAIGIEASYFLENFRPLESGMVVVTRRRRALADEVEVCLRRVTTTTKGITLIAFGCEADVIEFDGHQDKSDNAELMCVVTSTFQLCL